MWELASQLQVTPASDKGQWQDVETQPMLSQIDIMQVKMSLPVGLEAPVMTPNSVVFLFFLSSESALIAQPSHT